MFRLLTTSSGFCEIIIFVTKETSEILCGLITVCDFFCSARRHMLRDYFWCCFTDKLYLYFLHKMQITSLCSMYMKKNVHSLSFKIRWSPFHSLVKVINLTYWSLKSGLSISACFDQTESILISHWLLVKLVVKWSLPLVRFLCVQFKCLCSAAIHLFIHPSSLLFSDALLVPWKADYVLDYNEREIPLSDTTPPNA